MEKGRAKINVENMTLEEAVMRHRILWGGIAMLIDNMKGDVNFNHLSTNSYHVKNKVARTFWPKQAGLIDTYCFLCHFDTLIGGNISANNCQFCPLLENTNAHECLNGLFSQWEKALADKDFKHAKNLALQIAELPIVNRRGESYESCRAIPEETEEISKE